MLLWHQDKAVCHHEGPQTDLGTMPIYCEKIKGNEKKKMLMKIYNHII